MGRGDGVKVGLLAAQAIRAICILPGFDGAAYGDEVSMCWPACGCVAPVITGSCAAWA